MSKRFGRGLVVGKFCPLHLGHELLIERCLAERETTLIVSYTQPEFPRCEPEVREAWLRQRFPTAELLVFDTAMLAQLCRARNVQPRPIPANAAPDDEHREFVGWLCLAVHGAAVDAVFTSENYGDAFAASLLRYFNRNGAAVTNVQHVCVDQARYSVPISGTQIRANPHANKHRMSPHVYASFVERICILGGESSGKTTLARTLAERLQTCWAPEYGRELWERQQGALLLEDLVAIAKTQIQREDEIARRAHRWLFCDTSPLTTLLYSEVMFATAEPALRLMAGRTYDRVLLCAPDFEFVQDGTRRDTTFRQFQHDWYARELERRGVAYEISRGTLDARAAQITNLLVGAAGPGL